MTPCAVTFEHFVRDNARVLRHVARRAMPQARGPSDWEDAYQSALLRAWRQWSRGLRDRQKLCNQAAWGALDARRAVNGRNHSPKFVALDKCALWLRAPGEDAELRAVLAARLDRLPARERRIVTLILAGYRLFEIARMLGVSSPAVYQVRNRAVARMREGA